MFSSYTLDVPDYVGNLLCRRRLGDLSGMLDDTPAHDSVWLASFVKFTWHLPLLIIKHLTSDLGAGEHNLVPPGPAMCLGGAWKGDSGSR